jgi:hypothetical protein
MAIKGSVALGGHNDAYRDSRELLDGHSVLDIECLDRIYLNAGGEAGEGLGVALAGGPGLDGVEVAVDDGRDALFAAGVRGGIGWLGGEWHDRHEASRADVTHNVAESRPARAAAASWASSRLGRPV